MKDIVLVHAASRALLEHAAAAQAAGHHILVIDDTSTPETLSETLRGRTKDIIMLDEFTKVEPPLKFQLRDALKPQPISSDWNHPYPPPRRQKRK